MSGWMGPSIVVPCLSPRLCAGLLSNMPEPSKECLIKCGFVMIIAASLCIGNANILYGKQYGISYIQPTLHVFVVHVLGVCCSFSCRLSLMW